MVLIALAIGVYLLRDRQNGPAIGSAVFSFIACAVLGAALVLATKNFTLLTGATGATEAILLALIWGVTSWVRSTRSLYDVSGPRPTSASGASRGPGGKQVPEARRLAATSVPVNRDPRCRTCWPSSARPPGQQPSIFHGCCSAGPAWPTRPRTTGHGFTPSLTAGGPMRGSHCKPGFRGCTPRGGVPPGPIRSVWPGRASSSWSRTAGAGPPRTPDLQGGGRLRHGALDRHAGGLQRPWRRDRNQLLPQHPVDGHAVQASKCRSSVRDRPTSWT